MSSRGRDVGTDALRFISIDCTEHLHRLDEAVTSQSSPVPRDSVDEVGLEVGALRYLRTEDADQAELLVEMRPDLDELRRAELRCRRRALVREDTRHASAGDHGSGMSRAMVLV